MVQKKITVTVESAAIPKLLKKFIAKGISSKRALILVKKELLKKIWGGFLYTSVPGIVASTNM